MNAFKLLIFDCDGVLVDSEAITNRVFCDMLNELGLSLSLPEVTEMLTGRSMSQCLATVTELLDGELPRNFGRNLRLRAGAALFFRVTAMPGIHQALDEITMPVCVASSSEPAKIWLTLRKTGLYKRFAPRIYSCADVPHPKPAPDLYLHAAAQNSVSPQACIVVEDSPAGVQAAVAADMFVLGFTHHTPAEQLQMAGAHRLFSDMRALPELLISISKLSVFQNNNDKFLSILADRMVNGE